MHNFNFKNVQKTDMEKTTLTPTTKSLIYCKIKGCEEQIVSLRNCIENSEKEEFIEMWELEIEALDREINHWKYLLFNK